MAPIITPTRFRYIKKKKGKSQTQKKFIKMGKRFRNKKKKKRRKSQKKKSYVNLHNSSLKKYKKKKNMKGGAKHFIKLFDQKINLLNKTQEWISSLMGRFRQVGGGQGQSGNHPSQAELEETRRTGKEIERITMDPQGAPAPQEEDTIQEPELFKIVGNNIIVPNLKSKARFTFQGKSNSTIVPSKSDPELPAENQKSESRIDTALNKVDELIDFFQIPRKANILSVLDQNLADTDQIKFLGIQTNSPEQANDIIQAINSNTSILEYLFALKHSTIILNQNSSEIFSLISVKICLNIVKKLFDIHGENLSNNPYFLSFIFLCLNKIKIIIDIKNLGSDIQVIEAKINSKTQTLVRGKSQLANLITNPYNFFTERRADATLQQVTEALADTQEPIQDESASFDLVSILSRQEEISDSNVLFDNNHSIFQALRQQEMEYDQDAIREHFERMRDAMGGEQKRKQQEDEAAAAAAAAAAAEKNALVVPPNANDVTRDQDFPDVPTTDVTQGKSYFMPAVFKKIKTDGLIEYTSRNVTFGYHLTNDVYVYDHVTYPDGGSIYPLSPIDSKPSEEYQDMYESAPIGGMSEDYQKVTIIGPIALVQGSSIKDEGAIINNFMAWLQAEDRRVQDLARQIGNVPETPNDTPVLPATEAEKRAEDAQRNLDAAEEEAKRTDDQRRQAEERERKAQEDAERARLEQKDAEDRARQAQEDAERARQAQEDADSGKGEPTTPQQTPGQKDADADAAQLAEAEATARREQAEAIAEQARRDAEQARRDAEQATKNAEEAKTTRDQAQIDAHNAREQENKEGDSKSPATPEEAANYFRNEIYAVAQKNVLRQRIYERVRRLIDRRTAMDGELETAFRLLIEAKNEIINIRQAIADRVAQGGQDKALFDVLNPELKTMLEHERDVNGNVRQYINSPEAYEQWYNFELQQARNRAAGKASTPAPIPAPTPAPAPAPALDSSKVTPGTQTDIKSPTTIGQSQKIDLGQDGLHLHFPDGTTNYATLHSHANQGPHTHDGNNILPISSKTGNQKTAARVPRQPPAPLDIVDDYYLQEYKNLNCTETDPPKMLYPKKSTNSFWELTDQNVLDFVFALKKGSVLNSQDYDYPAGPVFAETVKWCEKNDGNSLPTADAGIKSVKNQRAVAAGSSKRPAQRLRAASTPAAAAAAPTTAAAAKSSKGSAPASTPAAAATASSKKSSPAVSSKKSSPAVSSKKSLTPSELSFTDGQKRQATVLLNDELNRRRAVSFDSVMKGGYKCINPFETNWLLTDKNLIK